MDDLEYLTDIATQRGYMVGCLAIDLESISDEKARGIVLEMMQKLTDTIIVPAKPKAELTAFPGGKAPNDNDPKTGGDGKL